MTARRKPTPTEYEPDVSEESRPESAASHIRRHIRERGPIPFSGFMELALYGVETGYYQTRSQAVGRDGDFLTAPEVGPVFGGLLGVQVRLWWERLGKPERFTIVEYGPGRGVLCRDILLALERWAPDCFAAASYRLVERSRAQRLESGRVLPVSWMASGKIRILESGVAGDGDEPRIVLANEFVDALPVHRVVRCDGRLVEVHVTWEDGRFVAVEGEPSTPELEQFLSWCAMELIDGQEALINLGALHWLDAVASPRIPMFVAILDYGHLAEVLYSAPGRAPTLACYSQHTVNFDPLHEPGLQDITSHVDFSALQRRATELGFQVEDYVPQSRFLLGSMGQSEGLFKWDEDLAARLQLKELVHPEGMGEKFQVLVLSRGIM